MRAPGLQKSSRNGFTSFRSDAIACAASPLRPAEAAAAVASSAVMGRREVLVYDADSGGSDEGTVEPEAAVPELEMVRSGITKEPSCMRSGPDTAPELGVVVSHSHESKDEAGGLAPASDVGPFEAEP